MSLDVWLIEQKAIECPNCGEQITVDTENTVFEWNITHNLGIMAREAGVYKHLWRPDELEIDTAKQLIEPLAAGLKELRDNPDKYEKFNPANGWGSYSGLVDFVNDYLEACMVYPEAKINISR